VSHVFLLRCTITKLNLFILISLVKSFHHLKLVVFYVRTGNWVYEKARWVNYVIVWNEYTFLKLLVSSYFVPKIGSSEAVKETALLLPSRLDCCPLYSQYANLLLRIMRAQNLIMIDEYYVHNNMQYDGFVLTHTMSSCFSSTIQHMMHFSS